MMQKAKGTIRVCHMSSAHHGLDVRIFHKECVSLAKAGFETHLVIKATPDEVLKAELSNVFVHALPVPRGRFSRMLKQAWLCYRKARSLKADVYHFHDSELIPYGIWLSFLGKKVIYDVHEDLPRDVLTKEWIPFYARKLVSKAVSMIEFVGAKYFFSVCTATPFIASRFKKTTKRAVDINNFPLLGELAVGEIDWSKKQNQVCYVGGIARIRGIYEAVQAMSLVQSGTRLQLGGTFTERSFEQLCHAESGWSQVEALGWLDRDGVRDVLSGSVGGLVTLHPVINYVDALPVKMFEYMAAGVPVIASYFPLWREIVEGNQCGICVDPLDPKAIAAAIDYLVENPIEAERMGRNGQKAVEEKYNWAIEEAKLLEFYQRILK